MPDWEQKLQQGRTAPPPSGKDWQSMLARGGEIEQAPVTPETFGELGSTVPRHAELSTIAGASFADKPQARIRYYAEARGIPIDRYEVRDNEIGYTSASGEWVPEVKPGSFLGGVAKGVGPALPVAAATPVAMLTAPLWLFGPQGIAASIAATGFAGAGGQAAREGIAAALTGQDVSPGRIAKEGAFAAAGEAGGALVGKALQSRAVRDIGKMSAKGVGKLVGKARGQGIRLSPAELTDLSSLKGDQRALSSLPRSADIMDEFYTARDRQIEGAINRFLGTLSDVDSPEVAGSMARAGAKRAMKGVAANRAKQAAPIYKKAFAESDPVDTRELLKLVDEELAVAKGGIRKALKQARELLFVPDHRAKMRAVRDTFGDELEIDEAEFLDPTLEGLHQSKMALDDMIDGARQSGLGNTAKAKLVEMKTMLLEAMDTASPDYGSARAIYADLSPGVQRVREGLTGIIANMKDEALQDAAIKMLGKPGPRSIIEARQLIQSADPDAWQALKRTFLEGHFEKASREFMSSAAKGDTLRGARFRALVFGDVRQRARLRAALEPGEFKAISDLMEVLEATGRAADFNSATAYRMEAVRDIQRRGAGVGQNLIEPWSIPRRMREWVREWRIGGYAEKLARAITDPAAMSKLKQLRQLTPNDTRAIALVTQALGLGANVGASAAVEELSGQQ